MGRDLHPYRGWYDFHLIPNLDLGSCDGPARQLQNALHLHAYRRHSEGHQAAPQLDDLETPIKADDIDTEGHTKSMDAGRWFDP